MTQVGDLRQIWLLRLEPLMPYLEEHTQNTRGFPRIAVPYLEYATQDRKVIREESLHQILLPRMRLLLVPYSEYPT